MKLIRSHKPGSKIATLVYIVFALFLGIFGIVTSQIGMDGGPDIWAQVYRIDSILNGDVTAHPVTTASYWYSNPDENYGGAVSWDMVNLSLEHPDWKRLSLPYDGTVTKYDDKTADMVFSNTAIYSPLSYIPYLPTLAASRALGLDAATSYYLMEIVGLLFFIAITSIAINLLPSFKTKIVLIILLLSPFFAGLMFWKILFPFVWALSGVGTSPAFYITTDTTVTSMAILLACSMARSCVKPPGRLLSLVMVVAAALLAFGKFAYAPLLFAPLLLMILHRKMRGRYILIIGCAISLVALVAWTSLFGSHPVTDNVSAAETSRRLHGIFTDPLNFLANVGWNIITLRGEADTSPIWENCMMGVLYAMMLFVIIASIISRAKGHISKRQLAYRIIGTLFVFASMLAIYTAEYLKFDDMQNFGINGIQPRYILPLVVFLLPMVCGYIGKRKHTQTTSRVRVFR
ncbi:MAG: DUF2142 domain-containing protein [Coriobacteriales bacterium]|jgi:uncharacterized membrane protein|nr:DUF2142 domain-containing protein [Coriobacteriales bacterium]